MPWAEFVDMLVELPPTSRWWTHVARRETMGSLPPEGPQTMEQVWNIFNAKRGVRRRNVQPWSAWDTGPAAHDPRLARDAATPGVSTLTGGAEGLVEF